MKITKRITAVLLAFALLISMMPPVFAETTDDTVLPPQATGISSTSDQVIAEAPDKNENALVVNEQSITGIPTLDAEIKNSAILNYIDSETLAKGGHISRCPELETLSSYVFKNADGTRTVYYMDHPVKYLDSNGTVNDINLTLTASSNDDGYETAASGISINIGSTYTDGVTVYLNGTPITLTASQASGSSTVKRSISTENISAVTTSVSQYALTYNNLFGNGTEVRYTPTYNGIKEEIVISKYNGTNSFTFTLQTNGLGVFEEDGEYYVAVSEGAKERISLGKTIVYDSKDNICDGTMSVTAITSGSLYKVTVSAPLDFLLDSKTVYPVIVDPEMTIIDTETETGLIEDSSIYELKPARNFGTYIYNRVGLASGSYGIGRTAVRLTGLINSPIYQNVNASQINSVKLYVKEASGHTGRVVDICPLTENSTWTESTVKWENVGAFGAVVSSSALSSNSFGQFDITQLVKGWKNGTYNEDCGFIMKGADETVNESFLSSEYSSNTAYRPYVVFEYTPIIALSAPSITLVEGQTLQTTVIVSPSSATVTYTSSNTQIASVNSSGVVTGIKAGNVRITASFTLNGITYSDYISLVILIADGVYYVINANGKYLTTEVGISNDTNVMQYARYTSSTGRFRQMWKIKHIGSGYYTIRIMGNLNMGLYIPVTSSNAAICSISAYDTYSRTVANARWTIEYVSTGYVLHLNGNTATALVVEGGNSSSGANAFLNFFTPNESTNRWSFSSISPAPSGINLYNLSSETITVSPTKYITPNESKTMSDLNLKAIPYSGYTISQTVNWYSSNTDIATVSSAGKVTGVSPGTVTITAQRSYSTYVDTASYTLKVTEISNGTYFIKSRQYDLYLENQSDLTVAQADFGQFNQQQWNITGLDNGCYKIVSTDNGLALSVPAGNVSNTEVDLMLEEYTGATRQQWSITRNASGNFIIKAQSAGTSNRVMSIGNCLESGAERYTSVQQREYINDNIFNDEWELLNTGNDVLLLSIIASENNHDHLSCYGEIMPILYRNGFDNFNNQYTNHITNTDCIELMNQCEIFISRSHGGNTDTYTFISLNDDDQPTSQLCDFQIYDFNNPDTQSNSFEGMRLALFVGCFTASHDETSLPFAAVARGADAAVGFRETIDCDMANIWTERFIFYHIEEGMTLEQSRIFAIRDSGSSDGLNSCVIVTNDEH